MIRSPGLIVYLLPVISGAAALILEVLWFKDLAVLFGNTAYAAAAVLSVFFLGLAAGGQYWGRWCDRGPAPLRLYGLLELGVAATALLFLGLADLYRQSYATLFDPLSVRAAAGAKLLLAASVLVPPAFFMGGTLPALAQHVAGRPARLGSRGSILYGLNTVGAAGGAVLAGFFLPVLLGFRGSYWVAIAAAAAAGLTALALALDGASRPAAPPVTDAVLRDATATIAVSERVLLIIAWLSGFLTLGMEVLWTRLLAQVLNNSTYAFSAILATFLIALGLGSLLTHVVLRRQTDAFVALRWTLALSGGAAVMASLLFVRGTRGLAPLAGGTDWPEYVRTVFTASAALLFVPVVLMGMVLPLLFYMSHASGRGPGSTLGRLLAVNSVGAIVGPVVTGFLLLDALGYWGTLRLLGGAYVVLGLVLVFTVHRRAAPALFTAVTAAGAIAIFAMPGGQPVVHLAAGERLVEVYEGSGGTVAVVLNGDNLEMRLNNTYILGDTRSMNVEQLQAHLPLLLHSAPRSVFFLGLGTGITAGAALDHPVARVVAAELLPEVVVAAQEHYAPFANGLFDDRRVRIVRDDGRSFLAGSREQYDVIVSDLFTPWHAGTGSLYTLEHFRTVREGLRPGGIFAQWLPLYQMSRMEFLIIARTMQAVFPQVTVWRGNFSPAHPILALVARPHDVPLQQQALVRNAEHLPSRTTDGGLPIDHMAGLFYAGNLNGLRSSTAAQTLNTDARPVIEYLSPRLQLDAGRRFVGIELDMFLQQLLDSLPPERDPVLAGLPARERRYVGSGLDFFRYHLYRAHNRPDSAAWFLERFRSAVGRNAGALRD